MSEYNKRKIGADAERRIRTYLSERGYEILEMNYRCRQGEVDIIAIDGTYYVFIEVKYRNSVRYGLPQEAVGLAKQKRISKAAAYYLYAHGLPESTPVRFDVAAVMGEHITYYTDAFAYR